MHSADTLSPLAPLVDDKSSFWQHIKHLNKEALRATDEWLSLDPFDRAMMLDGYSPNEIEDLRRAIE